jgi:hypothetical protein
MTLLECENESMYKLKKFLHLLRTYPLVCSMKILLPDVLLRISLQVFICEYQTSIWCTSNVKIDGIAKTSVLHKLHVEIYK